MPGLRRVHDRAILDALDAIDPTPFEGRVWRVTPKGREALRGSSTHGRWSPNGEFEVLYTSLEREGALTEIGHRLSLEPVWPSRLRHEIHRIEVRTERTLHIAELDRLQRLGVDVAKYQSFDYRSNTSDHGSRPFLGLRRIARSERALPLYEPRAFSGPCHRARPSGRASIRTGGLGSLEKRPKVRCIELSWPSLSLRGNRSIWVGLRFSERDFSRTISISRRQSVCACRK